MGGPCTRELNSTPSEAGRWEAQNKLQSQAPGASLPGRICRALAFPCPWGPALSSLAPRASQAPPLPLRGGLSWAFVTVSPGPLEHRLGLWPGVWQHCPGEPRVTGLCGARAASGTRSSRAGQAAPRRVAATASVARAARPPSSRRQAPAAQLGSRRLITGSRLLCTRNRRTMAALEPALSSARGKCCFSAACEFGFYD